MGTVDSSATLATAYKTIRVITQRSTTLGENTTKNINSVEIVLKSVKFLDLISDLKKLQQACGPI
jgi:hypothetical protein